MSLSHQPCPDCGSSDALHINDDGSTKCFSCNTFTPASKVTNHEKLDGSFLKGIAKGIPDRCLQQDVCKRYKYNTTTYKGKEVQIATYRDLDGKAIFQKVRFVDDKQFFTVGKFKPLLYGMHLFKGNTKKLIITEGEIDCLSVAQVVGEYPVVSIPNGAANAKEAIKHNLTWIEQFEEVIFCFDMDEVGQKSVKEAAELITLGKAKVMSLPLKDPNEMLKAGRVQELFKATWNAQEFRPDGIVFGEELWEEVNKPIEWGYDYPFPTMTKLTYGIRIPEIYAFGAGTGVGKTTIIKEFQYDLAIKQGFKVGCIHLEDTAKKVTLDFMSKACNKPLHKPDVEVTEQERRDAFENTVGTNRIYIYDSKGARDIETIKTKIREMVVGYGCQFIFLDHLKAITDATAAADEIKTTNKIVSDLVQLSLEINCTIFIITHLRKQPNNSKSFEEGGRISLDDYYGSGALKQYANFCWGFERNKCAENELERNTTTIRCLKDRYTGEADGEVIKIRYNKETGRLQEVSDDEVDTSDFTSDGDDF